MIEVVRHVKTQNRNLKKRNQKLKETQKKLKQIIAERGLESQVP